MKTTPDEKASPTPVDPETPPLKSIPLSSSTPHIFQTPVNPPPLITSKSCMPRPLFQDEPETFSTKKERREGGLFRPPPRPPAKSCPPKSRILRSRDLLKTQAVSFNDTSDKHALVTESPLHSSVYDDRKSESYFEQAFSIERKIGAGCFGTVYKVRCKEDNKLYAVKIAKQMYKGQSDRNQKLEEVRKHQFLPPHSNLVRFYKSWEERARLYQQFELCKTSLQDLGADGRLSEDEIWSYMVDLLQALQHLHEHDLIHVDIKPDNIFIGMDGICKLGDFGLMIDLAKGESEGMEGDPCYLAPEVLEGKFTKACDVFSLGVTLLELATDMDLPKGGGLWHDLRNRGPDPALTEHLQPELRRVIQLMMSRDPCRRPGVKQLLELPSVQKAVKRRSWQLLIAKGKEMVLKCLEFIIPLLTLLFAMLLSILQPIKQVWSNLVKRSSPPSTPPPFMSNSSHSVSQSMPDCFSDDEAEVTLSSSGSSLAAPLDSSYSDRMSPSSRHTPHLSAKFYSPVDNSGNGSLIDHSFSYSPMRRRPATSPGPIRARERFFPRTPGAELPLSPGKRLLFGNSDMKTPMSISSSRRGSNSPDLIDTPANRDNNVNFDDSDEDIVLMKPKSLAATFDCFSDED